MRLTAEDARTLTFDEKRSHPYRCLCGRTITGYCSVTTNPERCPFALLPRLRQPAEPRSRVVMAQPDSEACE